LSRCITPSQTTVTNESRCIERHRAPALVVWYTEHMNEKHEKPSRVKLSNLASEVANIVAERLVEQNANVDKLVEEYIEKHLPDIISCGLGITRRWFGRIELEHVNGFSGLISKYVQDKALRDAKKFGKAALDKLVCDTKNVLNKRALLKKIREEYVHAYEQEIARLARERLEANEAIFKESIEELGDEIELRIDILLKPHLAAVANSLDKKDDE
jgi:hypothetical protein